MLERLQEGFDRLHEPSETVSDTQTSSPVDDDFPFYSNLYLDPYQSFSAYPGDSNNDFSANLAYSPNPSNIANPVNPPDPPNISKPTSPAATWWAGTLRRPMQALTGLLGRVKQSMGGGTRVTPATPRPATPPRPPAPAAVPLLTSNPLAANLIALSQLSEKELAAYTRVKSLILQFEEEEKSAESSPESLQAAKPADLQNPFESLVPLKRDSPQVRRRSYEEKSKKQKLMERLDMSDITNKELFHYLNVEKIILDRKE